MNLEWKDIEEKIANTGTNKKDVKLFIATHYITDIEYDENGNRINNDSYFTNSLYIQLESHQVGWYGWENIKLADK